MAYDPYRKEKAFGEIADRLVDALEAGVAVSDDDLVALVTRYRRLVRENRRLIRLSDLSQDKLRRISTTLEERNAELDIANQLHERDLKAAARVQLDFLPPGPLRAADVSIDSLYVPSTHLSGDTLHYEVLDDQTTLFYLADVCGHGVPAALTAVTINAVLTAEFACRVSEIEIAGAVDAINPDSIVQPARVVAHVNQHFLARAGDQMSYFTMVVGAFNSATGGLTLCHAGAPYPILVPAQGRPRLIDDNGLPVGVFDDGDWSQQSHVLAPGDRLYLYSDGIMECPNPDDETFGSERLIAQLEDYRGNSLGEGLQAMHEQLIDWHGGEAFPDDISMIALEVPS